MKTIQQTLNEQLVLLEKLRYLQKGFDLNKLSKMDIEEANKYASQYFQKLGEGAARAVYLYSSKKVLKVAVDIFGFEQNKAELENQSEFTTKVFAYDNSSHEPSWLISELVRPLKTVKEFEGLLGISHVVVEDMLSYSQDWPYRSAKAQQKKKYVLFLKNAEYPEDKALYEKFLRQLEEKDRWLKGLFNFVRRTKLEPEDLYWGQWGVTPDRRAVILDSGFTTL